jgi:hypothetical protein
MSKPSDVLADIVLTALERQRQYGAFVELTANAVQSKQTHCTVLNAARRVYEKEIGKTTKAINDLIKACEGGDK